MSFYLLPGIKKATHTKVLLITNTHQWPESQQHNILIRSYNKENVQKKMFLNLFIVCWITASSVWVLQGLLLYDCVLHVQCIYADGD